MPSAVPLKSERYLNDAFGQLLRVEEPDNIPPPAANG